MIDGAGLGLILIFLTAVAGGQPPTVLLVSVNCTGPLKPGAGVNVIEAGFAVGAVLLKVPEPNVIDQDADVAPPPILAPVKVIGFGIVYSQSSSGPPALTVGAGPTVICRLTELIVLPHASVAVHVSVTTPPVDGTGNPVNVEVFEVPLIRHPAPKTLLNGKVDVEGNAPQATVISAGADIVGRAPGFTVIILDTGASVLPHASVAVQVSVTVPPQAPGVAVNVELFEVPLIRHPTGNPLLYGNVDVAGIAPHATVIFPGAVIVGNAAGLTEIVLLCVVVLP
jgi:hypothetical protein